MRRERIPEQHVYSEERHVAISIGVQRYINSGLDDIPSRSAALAQQGLRVSGKRLAQENSGRAVGRADDLTKAAVAMPLVEARCLKGEPYGFCQGQQHDATRRPTVLYHPGLAHCLVSIARFLDERFIAESGRLMTGWLVLPQHRPEETSAQAEATGQPRSSTVNCAAAGRPRAASFAVDG
jgi:hypothetical protein